MTPWQLLHAGRATRAAPGPRSHHAPGALEHHHHLHHHRYYYHHHLHHSRSDGASRDRAELQQLNTRLSLYLQQVQSLEADNQSLERQIQDQLDRKCPRELRQLDGHLRTVSLLQEQIRGGLSAQAQVKLQLLGAELAVSDFNARCEKERERGACVEAELNDLKGLEEGLKDHALPELQSIVNDQTQQLMELQRRHRQETQGLLDQVSGGVAVAMQTAESSDLIQQLDDLRRTSVTMLDKNQSECWSIARMSSMYGPPEVTFDPPAGSEVVQAELEELRSTTASLEGELTQLQALNMVLEASGLEHTDSFVQQLLVLQQREDGLSRDLDSVLQTTAQQAADHQTLLDLKCRLETEIQDYRRLLDGLSRQGFCEVATATGPSAFRRNITATKTISAQGGSLRMMTFPRSQILVVRKTPVLRPLSETVTAAQAVRVHSKHPKNLSARSMNTSNLTGSIHKSENQRTRALPERAGRESVTVSATTNRQSRPVEDKVHTTDCDQNSSDAVSQISQSLDERALKAFKPETNATQGITALGPDTQSHKMVLCAEPEVKQGPHIVTHTTTTDPSEETAEEPKKETETPTLAQMGCREDSIQAKNRSPAQVVSLSLETCAEAVRDAGEVVATAPVVSGSHILGSDEAQGKVPDEAAVVKASKPETNTEEGITTLVPVMQSARSVAVQAKPEAFTYKQTTTDAGLQATKTEITKTVLCAEPEVKQGPQIITHTSKTDPSKETAADVKKETETLTLAQMGCREDSILTKNQGPAQVVSLSLETCAEAVRDAGEVVATAPVVSGSHILGSEEAQGKVPDEGAFTDSKPESYTAEGITTLVPDMQSARSVDVQAKPEAFTPKQTTTDAGLQATKTETTQTVLCAEPEVKQGPHIVTHTTTADPCKETAEELNKETETPTLPQMGCREDFIQTKKQGPAQVVSLSLETCAEAVRDAGEVVALAPVVSGSYILGSDEAQGTVPDEGAVVKASKPETNTEEGITTLVPDMQSARSVDVQAKPEAFTYKQTTTEAGLQATKTKITQTVLCAEPEVKQGPHIEPHTTTTDPSKETAAELKKETETPTLAQMGCSEDSIQTKKQDPAQVVSLSLETCAEVASTCEGDAGEVAGTASHILTSEEAQGEVSGELVLIEDKHKESREKEDVEGATSKSSDSTPNKVMEDANTGSSATASSGSPDINDNLEIKTASTEILKRVEVEMNKGEADNGFHDSNEVKVHPTDSDTETVSVEGQEALLSTTQSSQSVRPTCSGLASSSADLEGILSPREAPVETEVLMSVTEQLFCPVDPEECVRSPDSLLSPNDRFLDQKDSCLSPVEPEGTSPNAEEEEEDEDVCLNLTEANAHVRPVEKYILSTKEEGQSLSFSRDQALPGEDRNTKVSVSVRSFEGHEGSTGANISSRPTSRGIDHRLSSSLGGLGFGDPGGRSTVADKEEQLGFGGLYHKSVRDMRSFTDRKGDQSLGEGPGGRFGSEDQNETSSRDTEVSGQKKHDWMFAKKQGGVPVNGGTTNSSVASNPGGRGMASDLAASFGGMAANSSGAVSGKAEAAATAGTQGRFRRGSGDWMVYGGNLGHTSTTLPSAGSEENLARATLPATSRPETGRFGRRGSGEGVVYGGSLGRKYSLDGGTSLPSEGKEGSPSVATHPATSPQESGRFGGRGSGEWMVYGGSLGRKNSLPRTRSENNLSVDVLPGSSPPVKGRFGSGEWTVYSGDSLPNTESRECPPGAQTFGSRDSGEWRVYGGSTGCLSSASNTNRVSASSSYGQVISPPNSYTNSGPRLSSAGSGGRLSSGSVVRRSSSVGSGGRLSGSGSGSKLSCSPGSQRTSRSGRVGSSGSGEAKPVYSSASGRMSTVRSASVSGAGGATSSQRAPSPGGRMSVGSGGWLSTSPAGGSRISSPGSGSRLSRAGSTDRLSSHAGGRTSSSSGSGRTNSTGGRVISSSDRPIRSTGSAAGGSKERISVCKMAALTISAAGRERSQDRRGQAERTQQQQKQQAGAASPLVQRWLTTGVGVTSAEPGGLDDIMRL